ncbi:DNA primase [Desulfurispirillum indicum]|uniref:DNA primase n=1 Tax=Desulfurispirillum indicum TaxID=936456 RepID=UPI001CFB9D52|nr:DNA primase [Desulfurispirillum indicum]UCZ56866.1 DNA primase [Desulfurispirillum indicum]
MRKIRQDSIERVLNAVDIVEIVGGHVHLRKAGGSHIGLCPFHSEKTPSFHVTPDKGLYYCFGCGAGGNASKFLMEKLGMTFVEAMELLSQKTGVALEYESGTEPREDSRRENLLTLNRRVLLSFRNQLGKNARARQYLESRLIPGQLIDEFGLGYADGREYSLLELFEENHDDLLELGLIASGEDKRLYDRFRQRVMFPIWDAAGGVVGFAGRDLSGKSPAKYMNSPESGLFEKKKLLYAYHIAKASIRKKRRAIVVEGYFDVIRAHQQGLTETVAVMGTSLSTYHARLLGQQTDVYVVFDGDEAGLRAALRTSELLTQSDLALRVVFLPDGHDPDTYFQRHRVEQFEELLSQARDVGEFRIDRLLESSSGDVTQLSQAVRELREFINRIPDSIRRQAYANYLRERTQIDPFGSGQSPSGRSRMRPPRSGGNLSTGQPLGSEASGSFLRESLRKVKKPVDKNDAAPYLLKVMFSSEEMFEEISSALGSDILSAPYSTIKDQATSWHLERLPLEQIIERLMDSPLAAPMAHILSLDIGKEDILGMTPDIIEKIESLYMHHRHENLKQQLFAPSSSESGAPLSEDERRRMLQELLEIQRELTS